MSYFKSMSLGSEPTVSSKVAVTHLLSPSVFATSTGYIGSTIQVNGLNLGCCSDTELSMKNDLWHQALLNCDDRFSVYVTKHRRPVSVSLPGKMPKGWLTELHNGYHNRFKGRSAYRHDLFITYMMKNKFFEKKLRLVGSGKGSKGDEQAVSELEGHVQQSIAMLKDFGPSLLAGGSQAVPSLVYFLGLVFNGGYPVVRGRVSDSVSWGCYDDHANEQSDLPEGHLGAMLSGHHICIGDLIQFDSGEVNQQRLAMVLSVKQYPSEASFQLALALMQVDAEWISTHGFSIIGTEASLRQIHRKKSKLHASSDKATTQHAALDQVVSDVAGQSMLMGLHHHTLMLMGNSRDALEKQFAEVMRRYAAVGMVIVRELMGLEPAFWSQLPGNQRWIARSAMITSRNFVHFCPLLTYPAGSNGDNHLKTAITILETEAKTPYFFNYHLPGSVDNFSPGHTMIVGGNNSGKTVFMTFVDAQMSRFEGCTYYFDRDRGAEIYFRAVDGVYVDFNSSGLSQFSLNPFALPDNDSVRDFLVEWLVELCEIDSQQPVSADARYTLRECVDYAYDCLDSTCRCLSQAVKLLPTNFLYWPALRRWLRATEQLGGGEYGQIFDNIQDTLLLSAKMAFDMTYLVDRMPAAVRHAILMYLFFRIEMSCNGQLVSIVLDEGWQYLNDSRWQKRLARWLPTLRKKNAHIVIATQSPSSIVDSPIRSALLDNIATQVYFVNPQAESSVYMDALHLSQAAYEFILSTDTAKRLMLIKQGKNMAVCHLPLAHCPSILRILSGTVKSVKRMQACMQRYGKNSKQWLPYFLELGETTCID